MAVTVEKINKWAEKDKTKKIVKALSSPSLDLRIAGIQALGTIDDEESLNTLIMVLRERDPVIRAAASEALGNLGNLRAKEFVRKLSVNDDDKNVREKALGAVNKLQEVQVEVEQEVK